MTQPELTKLIQEAAAGRLTRRTVFKRAAALGLSASAIAALLGEGAGGIAPALAAQSDATPESYAGGVRGGTLRVALESDLPTMDMPFTTRNVVGAVVWCIFESLFAYDAKFQLIPMLAESDTISDDKLTHTIKLRQGVKFHNGDEMKAADVVASITRWMDITAFAKPLKDRTKNLTQVDDYTIQFQLSSPLGALGHLLAMNNGACPIYPKAIADEAGKDQITKFIGTGPYKFVERQADRFIRLERFADYSALPGEAAGYGGHKYAYFDKIEFTPVPDVAATVAGLQAGTYDFAKQVDADQYDGLKGSANLTVEKLPVPSSWRTLFLNLKSKPLSNITIRQAIQAALDCELILAGAVAEGFYRLDPSLMFKETVWYSDVGKELYNRKDPETAKKLLQEANYDGTTLRFATNPGSENHAIVVTKQLQDVGLKVDLKTLDTNAWETLTLTTNDWELGINGYGFKPDPTQKPIVQMCPYQGHWCDEASTELIDQLYSESDFDARYKAWTAFQKNVYEQVPYVKFGDILAFQPRSAKLRGQFLQTALGITFWNMWFAQ